jgi:hypothetical protein
MDFDPQNYPHGKLLRSQSYDHAQNNKPTKRRGVNGNNTTIGSSTHRGFSAREEEAEIMRAVKENAGKVLGVVKPGNRFLGEVIDDDVEGGNPSVIYVEELKAVLKERRTGTI